MSEQLPRVFVGTMYCGEGDYHDACEAILSQKGVEVQHVIIANLPEKEAHNRLWHAWRNVQHDGFQMFVKVDADTVLMHDTVLLEFWKALSSNPRCTGIQAPLFDYFTNGNINGLNCFSPKVTFQDSTDNLFCDRRVDTGHDVVLRGSDVPALLTPAGKHCFKTHSLQAFHFGVHRQLKSQHDIIAKVRAAWKVEQREEGFDYTDGRSFALLGASLVRKFLGNGKFNYSDPELLQELENAYPIRKELLRVLL